VPYAAGANGDTVARILQPRLQERLGQPVIVDNIAGAGGNIGAVEAKNAPADGYTIMLATNTHAINMTLYKTPGFDLAKDFVPVASVTTAPLMLAVNNTVPVNSVAELVALAKKDPGKLKYASGGNGSSPHVYTELFKTAAGIDMLHVPYKAVAAGVTDFIAGRIEVIFNTAPQLKELRDAGKVKILATTTATRAKLFPDVPTLEEAGVKGATGVIWQGIVVAKGTPAPVVERLNKEIVATLNEPEVQAKLALAGIDAAPSSAADFGKLIDSDIKRWADVLKAAGVQPE
jgi:tripartite-type tricarboxylate transporter receptor subunit TctC